MLDLAATAVPSYCLRWLEAIPIRSDSPEMVSQFMTMLPQRGPRPLDTVAGQPNRPSRKGASRFWTLPLAATDWAASQVAPGRP